MTRKNAPMFKIGIGFLHWITANAISPAMVSAAVKHASV